MEPWYLLPPNEKSIPFDANSPGQKLLAAVHKSDEAEVRSLLESKAPAAFERRDPGTWGARTTISVLHIALGAVIVKYTQSMKIVEMLLEHKADVAAKSEDFDWRGCGSSTSAFQLATDIAMRADDPSLLQLIFKHGADPNVQSTSSTHSMRTDGGAQWTLLHTATMNGSVKIVRALLEAKADVNSKKQEHYENERGYNTNSTSTALHLACQAGNAELALLLLDAKANINEFYCHLDQVSRQKTEGEETDGYDDPRSPGYVSPVICVSVRETPLHIALTLRSEAVIQLLVSRGADQSIESVREAAEHLPAQRFPVVDACPPDLRHLLKFVWSPENHKLFPPQARRAVVTVMLCMRRRKQTVPQPILNLILGFAMTHQTPKTASLFPSLRKKKTETTQDPQKKAEPKTNGGGKCVVS